MVSVNGGTPPEMTPYPRPVTATDRVRQRNRWRRHDDLVARVLPHKNKSR